MKRVTLILAAMFAAFAVTDTTATGEIRIDGIQPPSGNEKVADVVNGVLPVAILTVTQEERGRLLESLYIQYSGDYPQTPNAALDVCIMDADKIVWQAPASFKVAEYKLEDGTQQRVVYDEFPGLNLYVAKGETKQYTLGVIRRSYLPDSAGVRDLFLHTYLYYNPGQPGYVYGGSGWIRFEGNKELGVWTNPADSLKDVAATPGRNILGGFNVETYSHNWWGADEEFILTNPTFRLFVSGGQPTGITSFELRDETGALLLKKFKVTDMGTYALLTFKGKIAIPRGSVAIFVHGRVGATFKGGAGVTLTFVPKDQGAIESTLYGAFSAPSTFSARSRELTFGVSKPVVPRPLPVTVPKG